MPTALWSIFNQCLQNRSSSLRLKRSCASALGGALLWANVVPGDATTTPAVVLSNQCFIFGPPASIKETFLLPCCCFWRCCCCCEGKGSHKVSEVSKNNNNKKSDWDAVCCMYVELLFKSDLPPLQSFVNRLLLDYLHKALLSQTHCWLRGWGIFIFVLL